MKSAGSWLHVRWRCSRRAGGQAAAGREDAEGRDGHRRRRPQRPRLQPPRLRRLLQAQKRLGVSIRVAESRSPADYIPNLAAFARQGYDLVARRRLHGDRRDGGRRKAVPEDALRDRRRRQRGPHRQAEERARPPLPRGAGRLPRRLPRRARGEAPPGRTWSARSPARSSRRSTASSPGTRRGAKRPTRADRRSTRYSQDFNDQAKCKAIALNQIAAGSVAVFAVAGGCGLGALDAAQGAERLGDRRRRRPVVSRPAHP